MYESFDECLRALLLDNNKDKANGGLVTKYDEGFNYNLNNRPVPEDGEPFLGIYRSSDPTRDWTAFFHGGDAARLAYRQYVSNPENGSLSRVA